jgi:hypothetical protein
VAILQTQRGIGGVVSLLFAWVVIVIPLQSKCAKHALHLQTDPPLILLAGFSLVVRIDAIGSLLE